MLGLLDFSWILNFPAWKLTKWSFPSGAEQAHEADQEGGSDSTDQEDGGLLVGGQLCGVES